MDLLRAEIAKAKAAAKEAKEALGSDGRDADAGKKYARRGDLEKAREERERERRRQLKLERAESEKQESSPRVRESTVEEPGKLLGDSDVSSLEIIQILRSMGLPVTLFGEDSSARLARMKKAKQEGNHDNYQLGEGHNTANTFLGRQGEGDQGGEERDRPSKRRRRKEEGQKDKEEDEGDVDDHTLVRRFFKQLLRDWEQDLNDRSETVRAQPSISRGRRLLLPQLTYDFLTSLIGQEQHGGAQHDKNPKADQGLHAAHVQALPREEN
jgi:hypothetical protein